MRRIRVPGGQTDGGGAAPVARVPEPLPAPPSREEEARQIAERLAALVESRRRASSSPVVGARHTGRLLGNLLLTRGFLVESELQYALARQSRTGEPIGEILVELGLISDRDLVELLAEQLRMEVIDLSRAECEPAAAFRLPKHVAQRLGAVPMRHREGQIDVAMADPTDQSAVTELMTALGAPLRLFLATRAGIDAAIERVYG